MTDSFDPYYTWLGIPPGEQPPNHYRLLGVREFEANTDVIANAADRQMTHVRTFQSGKNSKHSQHILNELAKAKICLLSPDKKQQYDDELRAAHAATSRPPNKPATAAPKQRAAQIKRPEPAFDFKPATAARAPRVGSTSQSKWLVPVIATGAVALVLIIVIAVAVFNMRNLDVPSDVDSGSDAGPLALGTTGDDGDNTDSRTESGSTTGGATTEVGDTDGGSADGSNADGGSSDGDGAMGKDPHPPAPAPAIAPRADGSIDLISLIDSSKYAISGSWTRQGPFLRCSEGANSFCAIPYEPKGAYELQFDVRRLTPKGVIQIHLPVGDSAVTLALHGKRSDGRYVAGLALSGGTSTGTAAAVVDPPAVNVVHRVQVNVAPQESNATIVADMDGKQIAFWSGPQAMLSSRLRDVPNPRHFIVGGYDVAVEFQTIRLWDKATPAVPNPNPSPPAPVVTDTPPPSPPPDERAVRIEAEAMKPVGGKSDVVGDFVRLKQFQSAREFSFEALQAGQYTFRVRAYGQQLGDEPAKMTIIVDNEILLTVDVKVVAARPKSYVLNIDGFTKGPHTFRVQFANDLYVSPTRDRDLFFDFVDIIPPAPGALVRPDLASPAVAPPIVTPPLQREAVPDLAAQEEALKQVHGLFKDEYAAAKTDAAKVELAQTLAKTAGDSKAPAVERYVLLSEASRLAVEGARADVAVAIIDAIGRSFETDIFQLKADALAESLKHTRQDDERKQLAGLAWTASGAALDAKQFDACGSLLKTVLACVVRPRDDDDRELRKDATLRLLELQKLEQQAGDSDKS